MTNLFDEFPLLSDEQIFPYIFGVPATDEEKPFIKNVRYQIQSEIDWVKRRFPTHPSAFLEYNNEWHLLVCQYLADISQNLCGFPARIFPQEWQLVGSFCSKHKYSRAEPDGKPLYHITTWQNVRYVLKHEKNEEGDESSMIRRFLEDEYRPDSPNRKTKNAHVFYRRFLDAAAQHIQKNQEFQFSLDFNVAEEWIYPTLKEMDLPIKDRQYARTRAHVMVIKKYEGLDEDRLKDPNLSSDGVRKLLEALENNYLSIHEPDEVTSNVENGISQVQSLSAIDFDGLRMILNKIRRSSEEVEPAGDVEMKSPDYDSPRCSKRGSSESFDEPTKKPRIEEQPDGETWKFTDFDNNNGVDYELMENDAYDHEEVLDDTTADTSGNADTSYTPSPSLPDVVQASEPSEEANFSLPLSLFVDNSLIQDSPLLDSESSVRSDTHTTEPLSPEKSQEVESAQVPEDEEITQPGTFDFGFEERGVQVDLAVPGPATPLGEVREMTASPSIIVSPFPSVYDTENSENESTSSSRDSRKRRTEREEEKRYDKEHRRRSRSREHRRERSQERSFDSSRSNERVRDGWRRGNPSRFDIDIGPLKKKIILENGTQAIELDGRNLLKTQLKYMCRVCSSYNPEPRYWHVLNKETVVIQKIFGERLMEKAKKSSDFRDDMMKIVRQLVKNRKSIDEAELESHLEIFRRKQNQILDLSLINKFLKKGMKQLFSLPDGGSMIPQSWATLTREDILDIIGSHKLFKRKHCDGLEWIYMENTSREDRWHLRENFFLVVRKTLADLFRTYFVVTQKYDKTSESTPDSEIKFRCHFDGTFDKPYVPLYKSY